MNTYVVPSPRKVCGLRSVSTYHLYSFAPIFCGETLHCDRRVGSVHSPKFAIWKQAMKTGTQYILLSTEIVADSVTNASQLQYDKYML
jgi:hypothetical protein